VTVTALRRVTLGGSDIGAVCGLNPYRSARRVSAELLGLIEPRPETEAARLGKWLEPHIAALASEQGYAALPAPADGLADAHRTWVVGHPDAFTVVAGERAVLELKNVGANVARHEWQDETPLYVQMQLQWYLHLTGLRRYLVAALIGGSRFCTYAGERHEEAIGYMLDYGKAFVALVRRGQLAEPDGSEDAAAVTRELWPEAQPGKVLRATGPLWQKVQEARERKWRRDVCERQWKAAQAELEAAMEDAEVLISPHDDEVARFRTVVSHPMDTKALRAALPHIADEYTTEKVYRRFDLL